MKIKNLIKLAIEHNNSERKRRVIIESPYRVPLKEGNWGAAKYLFYARQCVNHSVREMNEAPIASHLLFTQDGILDDEIKEERELGIAAGHAWIPVIDAMIVYEDLGISKGMWKGINEIMDNYPFIPIIYRKILI